MSARQRRRRETRRRQHAAQRPSHGRLIAAGGLTAGATLALSGVAHAAPQTYTVGTNADSSSGGACTTPTNTDCSLREAISLSNSNTDPDTIVFNSSLTGNTITLTSDQLEITDGVTITGPGFAQLIVDGDNTYRILYLNPASDDPVSISGLTLTNGFAASVGGAVYNYDADLTISGAVVSDSYTPGTSSSENGGGVYSKNGSLTIDSSTVTRNEGYYGGGVGSYRGAVTVTNSTISDNYADDYGGGIWTGAADLTVQGSTISGNGANQDGGGIYSSFIQLGGNGNPVTLENTTITDNHAVADDGGGVWVCCDDPGDALTVVDSTITGNTAATKTGGLQAYLGNASPVLKNSIVSGNTSGTEPPTDDLYSYAAHPWDASFSLIGVPSTYVNTTVPGSNLFGVDPQLGSLQDNGGPTYTMEPMAASAVIDCGSDSTHPVDQRGTGFPRVVDQPNRTNSTAAGANGADIGAVEVAANAAITGVCANNAPPPPPTPSAAASGQRAAALAKCKRKYTKALKQKRAQDALTKPVKQTLKKKFKKCKRRAQQLPV